MACWWGRRRLGAMRISPHAWSTTTYSKQTNKQTNNNAGLRLGRSEKRRHPVREIPRHHRGGRARARISRIRPSFSKAAARESVAVSPRRRRRARRRVAHALPAQPEPPARAAAERVLPADLRRPAALAPRALGGADGGRPAPDGGGRIGHPVVPVGTRPAAGRVRAARVKFVQRWRGSCQCGATRLARLPLRVPKLMTSLCSHTVSHYNRRAHMWEGGGVATRLRDRVLAGRRLALAVVRRLVVLENLCENEQ